MFFDATSSALSTSNGWRKTFGGPYWDAYYSIQQTKEGGYIITEYTESFDAGERDVWLIKTNSYDIEE